VQLKPDIVDLMVLEYSIFLAVLLIKFIKSHLPMQSSPYAETQLDSFFNSEERRMRYRDSVRSRTYMPYASPKPSAL
jgi:hypothetical protein